MRVFLAIVAVNVVVLAAVVGAAQLWPSFFEDEGESSYVCKTLDNGLDAPYTPVEVCISRTDITDGRFEACSPPVEFGGIDGSVLIVRDPENDTYCALALPEENG